MTEAKVAIITPTRNEFQGFKDGYLPNKIHTSLNGRYAFDFIPCIGQSTPEFCSLVDNLKNSRPWLKPFDLGDYMSRGPGQAYVGGLYHAMSNNYDVVVEMDGTGAHDPSALPDFIDPILNQGIDAVFSTRFSNGGRIDQYPLSRKLTSQLGTVLANTALGCHPRLPDFTSGYESFSNKTLQEVFKFYTETRGSWQNWFCNEPNTGALHFIQTEVRAAVLSRGKTVKIQPIVWGTNRQKDPNKLPATYLLKSFINLLELRRHYSNNRILPIRAKLL